MIFIDTLPVQSGADIDEALRVSMRINKYMSVKFASEIAFLNLLSNIPPKLRSSVETRKLFYIFYIIYELAALNSEFDHSVLFFEIGVSFFTDGASSAELKCVLTPSLVTRSLT